MARFRCPKCNTPLPAGAGRVACPSCGAGVKLPTVPDLPASGNGPMLLAALVGGLLLLTAGAAGVTYLVLRKPNPEPVAQPKGEDVPKGDPAPKPDPVVALPGPEELIDFTKKRPEASFLPADARTIVSVRAAELWATPAVQKSWAAMSPRTQAQVLEFNRSLGMKIIDYERVTAVVHDKGSWLVLKTVAPLGQDRLKALLSGAGKGLEWKPEFHEGATYFVGINPGSDGRDEPLAILPASSQLFVAAKRSAVREAITLQAAGVREGQLAFAGPVIEGGKSQVVLATTLAPSGLMPAALARTGAVLIEGQQNPDKQVRATARFPNAVAEKEDGGLFGGLGKLGGGLLDAVKPGSAMGGLIEKATGIRFQPVAGGTTLEAMLDADRIAQIVADTFGKINLDGLQSLGGFGPMAEIAAALARFHQAEGRLPRAVYASADGKPLYSWRVALLPYLNDEGKKRYEKFDRTKAWDEGPNKALTADLPAAFAHPLIPRDRAGNGTVYQMPVGPKAVFHESREPTLGDVGDAARSTVLLFIRRTPVPWAAPVDVTIPAGEDAAARVVPELGFLPDGAIEAMLFDGSPRLLPRKLTGRQLLDAVDPRSGAALPPS